MAHAPPPAVPSRPLVLVGCAFAAVAACAGPAALDRAAEPVAFFGAPSPGVTRSEREYPAPDGRHLGYVEHRSARPRAAIVYLHGIESHAGWFAAAADGLAARGYDVFCLDRRGSGINRENRGFTSGHVDSYETLLADTHAFMAPLRGRYPRVFLCGLSWGGKLALAHAFEHPGDQDALVLITPGLKARVDLPLFEKLGVLLGHGLFPERSFATPIEPEMFTTTPRYLDLIRRDPLRLERASSRLLWQSHRLDGLLDERIAANRLPILLFLAGQDRIIDNDGVLALLAQGKQEVLEVIDLEDQTHSIQFDATATLVGEMDRFLARFVAPRAGAARDGHGDEVANSFIMK